MPDVESTTAMMPDDALLPTKDRVSGGLSLLERWIERDPETAVKRVETMVKVLEQVRAASIRATYPPDWVIHKSVDRATGTVTKEVGYLQDSGAERAAKVWGIELSGPLVERQDFPDGTFMYTMAAEARSKLTGERIEVVMGSRWSGDGFFKRTSREGDDEAIDPTDVQKAAYANLHGRAVRALAGLNAVPLEMLKQNGIDTGKVVHVSYEKGAKGGESVGAEVGTSDVVVAFGRSQGKPPAELTDSDLEWYRKAYGENVLDPAKKRYVRANQRVLDALTAEHERRQRVKSQPAAPEAPAPAESTSAPNGGAKGRLVGDVWARLTETGGKQAMPLLAQLGKTFFGLEATKLSELTEEQLRQLTALSDEELRAAAAALPKR